MAEWLVYGCRTDYAAEVAEIIWRRGDTVRGLVDNLDESTGGDESAGGDASGAWTPDVPVVHVSRLDPDARRLHAVIPQSVPGHRHTVEQDARSQGFTDFPALVDRTAVVARSAAVEEGTVIGPGSVVAAMTRIGRFVLLNRSSSIGHHNHIDDYVCTGPSVVTAGRVTVGRGAFLGAGAVITPGVTIGANATVGAGAVVLDDVADGAVVVGNPARMIRSGTTGYQGLAVP